MVSGSGGGFQKSSPEILIVLVHLDVNLAKNLSVLHIYKVYFLLASFSVGEEVAKP